MWWSLSRGLDPPCGWHRDIFLPEALLLRVSAAARTDRALSTSVRLDGPSSRAPRISRGGTTAPPALHPCARIIFQGFWRLTLKSRCHLSTGDHETRHSSSLREGHCSRPVLDEETEAQGGETTEPTQPACQ